MELGNIDTDSETIVITLEMLRDADYSALKINGSVITVAGNRYLAWRYNKVLHGIECFPLKESYTYPESDP